MIDKDTGEIITPFLRTPYNYDMEAASNETALHCPEPTLTQQHFKEECDINTIVERFGLTGELPQNLVVPLTGDFTEAVTDFQTAMNHVRASEEAFMKLPAQIRARFNNDPQQLLEFVEDERNRDEAIKWGIVNAPKAEEPAPKPPEPKTPAA